MFGVVRTQRQAASQVGGTLYTVTRYQGQNTYQLQTDTSISADLAAYYDYGPKLGGGWSYCIYREATPEEQKEGRIQLQKVASACMTEQGL